MRCDGIWTESGSVWRRNSRNPCLQLNSRLCCCWLLAAMLFEGSDKTSPRLLPAKRVEKTNFNQKRLKRLLRCCGEEIARVGGDVGFWLRSRFRRQGFEIARLNGGNLGLKGCRSRLVVKRCLCCWAAHGEEKDGGWWRWIPSGHKGSSWGFYGGFVVR